MQTFKIILGAIGGIFLFIVGALLGRRSTDRPGSGTTGSDPNGTRPRDPGPGQANSDLGNDLGEIGKGLGEIKAGNKRSSELLKRARSILERAKKKNGD